VLLRSLPVSVLLKEKFLSFPIALERSCLFSFFLRRSSFQDFWNCLFFFFVRGCFAPLLRKLGFSRVMAFLIALFLPWRVNSPMADLFLQISPSNQGFFSLSDVTQGISPFFPVAEADIIGNATPRDFPLFPFWPWFDRIPLSFFSLQ